eukprot:15451751-Alexandrium_andersonii.AAC.2
MQQSSAHGAGRIRSPPFHSFPAGTAGRGGVLPDLLFRICRNVSRRRMGVWLKYALSSRSPFPVAEQTAALGIAHSLVIPLAVGACAIRCT